MPPAEDDWFAFRRAGVDDNDLLALLERADACRDGADSAGMVDALTSFCASHRIFPIRAADGGPITYGMDFGGPVADKLRATVASLSEKCEAAGTPAEELILLARLNRMLGDVAQAETALRRILEADPQNAQACFEMGMVRRVQSRAEDALDFLRRAVEGLSESRVVRFEYASMLQIVERNEEAVAEYDRILEDEPDHARTLNDKAWSLRRLERFDDAIETARRAVDMETNSHTLYHLAYCQLSGGRNAEAEETCLEALRRNPRETFALALLPSAMAELGRHEDARRLCDFEHLLSVLDLNKPPPGYDSLEAFNRALTEDVLSRPSRIFDPYQTMNILLEPSQAVLAFTDLVNRAVRNYFANLPTESSHPFVAQTPTDWTIDGWATRIKEYPDVEPHFHKHAWLSGVYYVKVPKTVARKDDKNGWIQFMRMPRFAGPPGQVEAALVAPVEGMMLLFPSYMYHRILPLKDDDWRISLAFNIVPKV